MSASLRRRFARDEVAASSYLEDLPAFGIVVVAIGIFVLTALGTFGGFKSGYTAVVHYEDAYKIALSLRADDAFLVPFASQPGEFSYEKIVDLEAVAAAPEGPDQLGADPEGVRTALGIPPMVRVRVIDVNQDTCPDGCELFRFDNDVPESGGELRIFQMPVTITLAASEVHGGVLEVATWRG